MPTTNALTNALQALLAERKEMEEGIEALNQTIDNLEEVVATMSGTRQRTVRKTRGVGRPRKTARTQRPSKTRKTKKSAAVGRKKVKKTRSAPTPARKAAMKLQGQYMGYLRGIKKESDRNKVKAVSKKSGVKAGLAYAKKLAMA